MKRQLPVMALTALLTFAGAATSAAAEDLRSSIPFEFTAGTQTLPAGTYRIRRPTVFDGLLDIRNERGGVFALSPAEDAGEVEAPARLVFARYRDRYFLRAVWFSRGRGYTLPQTMEEREQARIAATPEIVVSVDTASLPR